MNNLINKIKPHFNIKNITAFLYVVLLLIGVYSFNGRYLFYGKDIGLDYFAIPYYIVLLIVLFIGIMGLLFLLYKQNKINKSYFLSIIFVIWLIIGLIIISTTSNVLEFSIRGTDGNIYSGNLEITNYNKQIYILAFIGEVMCIYLATFLINKCIDFKLFAIGLNIIIGFGFAAIIASLFLDKEAYIRALSLNFENYYIYAPRSILGHHNIFGMMLFYAMVAGFVNYSVFKKRFYLIINFLFFIFLVFTTSKASLLSAAVLWGIFYICLFFTTLKAHKKRNIIIALILLVAVLSLLIVMIATNAFDKIFNSHGGGFFITFYTRVAIWDKVIQALSQHPVNMMFGFSGFHFISNVVYHINLLDPSCPINQGINACHNTYIQTLGTGGIFLCLVAAFGLIYLFYKTYILYKKDKIQGLALFSCTIAMLVLAIFEG